jgi:hypothetical protein
MQIDFLEEIFICLEVASPSMEMQDAHEHILVVGKVCHSLDILYMGVLTKLIVRRIQYVLSMYQGCTSMYHFLRLAEWSGASSKK